MAFRLPREHSPQFSDLFKYLDIHRKELDVGSYGLSVTTLEEVFLNITRSTAIDDGMSINGSQDVNLNGHLSMLELQHSHSASSAPVDSECCASKNEEPDTKNGKKYRELTG